MSAKIKKGREYFFIRIRCKEMMLKQKQGKGKWKLVYMVGGNKEGREEEDESKIERLERESRERG